MTGSSDSGEPTVAGGSVPHIPVLSGRVIEFLAPRDGGVYVDATFGAGGHTQAILAAARCRVIALDRDPQAVARGRAIVEAAAGRLVVVEERFSRLADVVAGFANGAADGVLLDLGVSSMQLDAPERGFSFRFDAPLDMRMGAEGPTAADLLARASERDLAAIIATLGEERHARAVARAIARRRHRSPIRTTGDLAAVVGQVVRSRPADIHPATRTFQALRMFLNREIDELAAALLAAESVLVPGGRLVVIAFHSLEDRIVKRFLAARSRPPAASRHQPAAAAAPASFRLLTNRPVVPDAAEVAANPRARSARLRAAERTDAPPSALGIEAVPSLPSLADVMKGG
ncbi:MAG TPA: 16S rRNA (cytosine(1402)-N(4))-methyltransferase RsmH [Xanthobacteraceae bacterium]|nr:16S rRNA (cytosine(1402)-N(4))-methyltransferase RsmH [Xanthobacteraceae bacterium]